MGILNQNLSINCGNLLSTLMQILDKYRQLTRKYHAYITINTCASHGAIQHRHKVSLFLEITTRGLLVPSGVTHLKIPMFLS